MKNKPTPDHRLSELRNIGPACEQDLNAAGILTAEELKLLEPEDAFLRMLLARKASGRSTKCCNAAYLYAIYGAIHDIDWRDVPASEKKRFKDFTAELRSSGQFG